MVEYWCHVCRNKRPECGKCTACLTQRTVWFAPKQQAPKCPQCQGTHTKATRDGSRRCNNCGAEFEPVEVSFCDSRPDVNAEKREEYERRRVRGRHRS